MGGAFYNEHDPKAAAWLRELIAGGHIAPGIVDERSIADIRPHELYGYTQHHFFAGVGGWSLALRLARWSDDKPVRTGSCPCQPFSISGKGLAEADERHLWPNFRDLITFGEPAITFGEQVASPLGREWLAGVRADLEGLGYEVGAADLCAAGVGAPHPRQRLYWVANPDHSRSQGRGRAELRQCAGKRVAGSRRDPRGLVLADGAGRDERRQGTEAAGYGRSAEPAGGDGASGMGDAKGWRDWASSNGGRTEESEDARRQRGIGGSGAWSDFDVLPFRDGKQRRVEAGSFPLAHGVPDRVGLLRGYGNAIVPQVAALFIESSIEAINDVYL